MATGYAGDREGYSTVCALYPTIFLYPLSSYFLIPLRFHALYFPSFLLALDLELPKVLLSHSHWTVNQVKMSKSLGNVVDPFGAMKTYGVDVVRWYLARVGGRFAGDVGEPIFRASRPMM